MRDDLLSAQACVDWAVSHFPPLEKRLQEWVDANVEAHIKELEVSSPNDLIVATEKEPLPLAFNVEVGAYVNVLRSSLDIVATALAYRHSMPNPETRGRQLRATDVREGHRSAGAVFTAEAVTFERPRTRVRQMVDDLESASNSDAASAYQR